MPRKATRADRPPSGAEQPQAEPTPRPLRADAQRNITALLEAARVVLSEQGVDTPAKDITDRAGVGVGTLYRHFPQRSDLVRAVLIHELAECIATAAALRETQAPGVALERWLLHYTTFVATKRGLAAALFSGDPAFDALPEYLFAQLDPVVEQLLAEAAAAGDIQAHVRGRSLLYAVGQLCLPIPGADPDHSQRMVALLVDGLRFRA